MEHLLRDIKNVSAAESLSTKIQRQLVSLKVRANSMVTCSMLMNPRRTFFVHSWLKVLPWYMCHCLRRAKVTSLQELGSRVVEIADYLELVGSSKLPISHPIVYQLQVRARHLAHASLTAVHRKSSTCCPTSRTATSFAPCPRRPATR